MKTWTIFCVASLILLGAPVDTLACEPIVPFVKAAGGSGLLAGAFTVLFIVVLVKAAVFALFQKQLSFSKAMLWMLGASGFTSLIGVVIPAMINGGFTLLIGAVIVWAICLLPVERAMATRPLALWTRCGRRGLALIVTLLLVSSCLLFGVSRAVQHSASFPLYWTLKISPLYIGLIIGMAVTAFWEEWIVWRLSASDEQDVSFVRPVVRANFIVLAAVMIISAAIILPKRWKEPGPLASAQPNVSLPTLRALPAKQ